MDKELNSTNNVKEFLYDYIEKYVRFVNQAIHDNEFLECMRRLLPFDSMTHVSINMVSGKTNVRKMGLAVMRMDIEPSVFSLAVTMTFDDGSGKCDDTFVFITACKTIEELQHYVKGGNFRRMVLDLCRKKAVYNTEILQTIP